MSIKTRFFTAWFLAISLTSVVMFAALLSLPVQAEPQDGSPIRLAQAASGPLVALPDLVVTSGLQVSACQGLDDVTLATQGTVALPNVVSAGHPVPFTATVAPPSATLPIEYAWTFGDGQSESSTLSTTTHVYNTPGLYTALVTATNCAGGSLVTDILQIDVVCNELVAISVDADSPVELGYPMHFESFVTPMTASLPIAYIWDFDDLTGQGSGLDGPSPTFTYTKVGSHDVIVTAVNCDGAGLAQGTFQAVVQSACLPLVEIEVSADPPVIDLGQSIHFRSTIEPTKASRPIDYAWDFGAEGILSRLNVPSPIFTYTQPGMHTVVITSTNCGGTAKVIDEIEVHVNCAQLSQVDFAWSPQPVYLGVTTTFTASVGAGSPPLSYTWRFGDDDSQTSRWSEVVSHTFEVNGAFPVSLTVANPCGSSAPLVRQVSVALFDPGHKIYLPLVLGP